MRGSRAVRIGALIGVLGGIGALTAVTAAPPAAAAWSRDGGAVGAPDNADGEPDDSLLEGLTGLGEGAAASLAAERGLTVRVVARDGVWYQVTQDYRYDRVNFVVENGVVAQASIG